MNRKLFLLLIALMLALAAGCNQEVPVASETLTPPTAPVEQLTLQVNDSTIGQLDDYPDLKFLDLSGSTCYEAITQYIKTHPRISVTYTVALGSMVVSNNDTALVVDPGACDYETLAENLQYLPKLTQVQLPLTDYTAQQIVALEGLYPEITWDYSIILLGQELTHDATSLNLSVLTSSRVAEAAEKLSLFPNLTSVELMDAYGKSELTIREVAQLMDAAPHIQFHYAFPLFGSTVSTADTRLEFVGQDLGDNAEAQLREAFTILRNCEYLLLDDCGLSNDTLAKLRDEFRGKTQIVWRVRFGVASRYSVLSDVETLYIPHSLTDETSGPMAYLENIKNLYICPTAGVWNVDFVANMPQLEICILSGTYIQSLESFANATNLKYLELAHCGHIEDITPLAGCENLQYLNLSHTKVTDLTPLYDLPLKQFCAVVSKIPYSQQKELTERMHDCDFRFEGTNAYGTGWRYQPDGSYTEIYAKIREIFDLDN